MGFAASRIRWALIWTDDCALTALAPRLDPHSRCALARSPQVVSIRGGLDDVIKAMAMIMVKQADDPEYFSYGGY